MVAYMDRNKVWILTNRFYRETSHTHTHPLPINDDFFFFFLEEEEEKWQSNPLLYKQDTKLCI